MIITKQIAEGNQKLATFMGGKLVDSQGSKRWTGLAHGKNLPESLLKYHEDYGWIMPVYEKIVYEIIGKKHDLNSNEDVEFFDQIGKQWKMMQYAIVSPVDLSKKTPVFAIWQAVVAFLNWYEQAQPQQLEDATA